MTELWNLSVPHAALAVSLPASTCSHGLCVPHGLAPYAVRSTSCGGHTRMTELWNLSVPHAALRAILPESKCSPVPCGKDRGDG